MNNPLISVIVPTFQRVNVLERAYRSVSNQTFQEWELLIIDDGSTDGTEEMVKKWQEDEPRVFLHKRPTDRIKGPSTCRNIGIQHSQGKYLAFLDSDDEWLPGRLEKAFLFLTRNKAEAIYSGALVKRKNYEYMRLSRSLIEGEPVIDFILNPATFTQTSTLILHREIAQKVSFDENMTHHEDYDFFIQVSRLTRWRYLDDFDVIVHWQENAKRKINYRNCLDFYLRYKSESIDKAGRIRYLSYMSEDLVQRKGDKKFLNEYQQLLKQENQDFSFRKRILFFSPSLFRLFLKFRNFFKK